MAQQPKPPEGNQESANEGLTLRDLCLAAGIDSRTFRYWVHARLLPPIDKTGPGVRYPVAYLHAVRRIQELQREGHTLQAIAKLLDPDDRDTRKEATENRTTTGASQRDPEEQRRKTLQELLGVRPANVRIHGGTSAPTKANSTKEGEPATGQAELWPGSKPRSRSAWDRYVLRPGIELHVQRPADRDTQRRIEQLLEQAARLFSPDSHPKGPGATSSEQP